MTRISLGVQSLRDAQLRALARGHTAREARDAYAAARGAGFDNVSLDLIYGIPGQSLDDWRAGLRAALELAPDHVSCYALQLALAPDEWAAPPRPGALRWRTRVAQRQDDALASDQYRVAEEMLDGAGYRHYELSSWARPGRESRHNSAYWARRPYTGIGAGAHSYDGIAERSWNLRDLDGYLRAAEAGERPLAGREELDEPTRAFEAVALGLRRVQGLSRRAFAAEFGAGSGPALCRPGGRWSRARPPGDRWRPAPPDGARPAVRLGCQPPVPAARGGGSPRRAAGLMLFPPVTLQAIADGKVTLAFRRWEQPRVKAGGRQRTAIGVIAFDAVEPVDRDDLEEADATAAGFASVNQLLAFVDRRAAGTIYRIRLRLDGPDPRVALRESLPDAGETSSAQPTAWIASIERATTERGRDRCCA